MPGLILAIEIWQFSDFMLTISVLSSHLGVILCMDHRDTTSTAIWANEPWAHLQKLKAETGPSTPSNT